MKKKLFVGLFVFISGMIGLFMLIIHNQSTTTTITQEQGHTSVTYIVKDGKYIANGKEYLYKKVLNGRETNAEKDTTFTVLTNNDNITFHDVSWSMLSSDSNDWLNDTVIIDIK